MILFIKNLLFTILAPGTVAVLVPLLMMRGREPAGGIRQALAFPMLAVGATLYIWCVWHFGMHGRGTPLPMDAPKLLVARGPYTVSRNPMYLAVLTMILGWALYFGSFALLLYALIVATAFHTFVITYEEPHLTRVFGEDYKAYREQVGRWLPRVRR